MTGPRDIFSNIFGLINKTIIESCMFFNDIKQPSPQKAFAPENENECISWGGS